MPAKSRPESNEEQKPEKRTRKGGAHRQHPAHPLEEALTLATAIVDANAGKPMKRLLLADAVNRSPSSSAFKMLLSSANKYGLVEGNEKSEDVSLTPLGTRIAKPVSEEERLEAVRSAALTPELLQKIFQHFNQNKLPQGQLFHNLLERSFNVDSEHVQEVADLISSNGKFANLLRDISGSPYVMLEGTGPPDAASPQDEEGITEPQKPDSLPKVQAELVSPLSNQGVKPLPVENETLKPKQIFVAHGKSRQSMEQLEKILNRFKIPHVIAINEPNAGRPISQKIAEVMQSCSAAIFVFTKDEEFTNKDGETVWRPSENLIYELGVASYLYGNKIILLKEEGIKFASDFQDLGYITFSSGDISAKGIELFQELIALNFIRVEAA